MTHLLRQSRGVDHEPTAPTLAVEHLYVAYAAGGQSGSRQTKLEKTADFALADITFKVEAGERIAVVGPNGAGKSTLFKLIVGTLQPSQGRVDIYGHDPDGHICIAYVPQRNQIDWQFPVTVEDVVLMGRASQIGLFRWPKPHDRALVAQSLARVGASHLAKKQIGELSGGQQQRVFIARALAQEASLLLLDEPMTGLDVPSKETLFAILDSLRPDGVTVVVATHDLTQAAERFDKVLLLNREVVAFGEPTAVFQPDNLLRAYGGKG